MSKGKDEAIICRKYLSESNANYRVFRGFILSVKLKHKVISCSIGLSI